MDPTIIVRLATIEDAACISSLILCALHEVNMRDYGPALIAEQSKNWTVDGVVAKMRDRITYVAIDDDQIVGTAGFDGQQARTVFVRPDRHKLGVGSFLMRAVEALATVAALLDNRARLLSALGIRTRPRRLPWRRADNLDGETACDGGPRVGALRRRLALLRSSLAST